MQGLLHAFLKAYLPKEITVPDDYKSDSVWCYGNFDSSTYTFSTKEMAVDFVKAIKPFTNGLEPQVTDNSVKLSCDIFYNILKIACGPVLKQYANFLSPDRYNFEEDPYHNFHVASVVKSEGEKLISALKEIGVNASLNARGEGSSGLVYMRRVTTNVIDCEKLANQIRKVGINDDYESLLKNLSEHRNKVIAILKEIVKSTGHEKSFYYTDDERGFRILSRNKELVEAFSAKVLIGQFDYNWDPKAGGRAWERGGHGSGYGEFLVVVDLMEFEKLYNKKMQSLESKAPPIDNREMKSTPPNLRPLSAAKEAATLIQMINIFKRPVQKDIAVVSHREYIHKVATPAGKK